MQTFKIRHFWGIPCLYQSLKAGLHQCSRTTAKYSLLAKKIRFCFFTEGRFDNASTATAIARRVRQRNTLSLPSGVLGNRDQTGNATARYIRRTDGVPGTFGRNHDHIQISARLNQLEMNIEPVGKRNCRTLLDIRFDFVDIQRRLQFIGN